MNVVEAGNTTGGASAAMDVVEAGTTMVRGRADLAMDRYANGDDGAFGEVYEEMAPRLFAFIRRFVKSVHCTEDLLQQTLLQMHRGRASFLPGSAVVPWAFAIARRLRIDSGRKDKRQVPIASDEEVEMSPPSSCDGRADEVLQARQTAKQIERVLDSLPEAQRVAFELTKLDGLSIAEAAETLGTTPTAVKLRVHRASEALKAALEKERL
jgi:RNA polymerase sigma-70 factor (ECF subfamily)